MVWPAVSLTDVWFAVTTGAAIANAPESEKTVPSLFAPPLAVIP